MDEPRASPAEDHAIVREGPGAPPEFRKVVQGAADGREAPEAAKTPGPEVVDA